MSDLQVVAPNYLIRYRTNYQLKHFVIGQHDTPEMRYRQILIEAKQLLFNIETAKLGIQIDKLKIEKLEKSGDAVKKLKAAQMRLAMVQALEALKSVQEEFDYLVELSKDYRHYTPDEIEANQDEYWELRLTRQATTDRMALEQGIDSGNLASMINAGLVQRQLAS